MRRFALLVGLLAIVGCACPPVVDHLAGVPLGSAPYFHHREVFVENEDLYVALDPNRYTSRIGDTYSIHVVAHKTPAEWHADPSLADVTGSVETSTLAAGSLDDNKTLAWSNMSLPTLSHRWHKQYDIVFDFGGDGNYDEDRDIIDRIGVLERLGAEASGGFTLLRDPAARGDFPVSVHEYTAGTFTPFTVSVPEMYRYGRDPTIHLIGKLYYPSLSTSGNIGIDLRVSTEFSSYPLIIIAHGKHSGTDGGCPGAQDNYRGYDYLGEHLARRGFIVASIALHELCDSGAHHRGVTILRHVEALLSDSTEDRVINDVRWRMDSRRVGLLGHSMGGEGVVAAQEIFSGMSPAPSYAIKAVASLSPSDGTAGLYPREGPPGSGPYDPVVPYLMIYGTRDNDLAGYLGQTGYRIVDRSTRPRHMITIYGGNHNFFNQRWDPEDGSPSGDATIERSEQEELTKVFVTSFFSDYLLDQQAYVEMFSGYVVPPSVSSVGTTLLYGDQPERWAHLTIDDSEDYYPRGAETNSLGEPNSSSGLVDLVEESLRYQSEPPNYYTHDTRGLMVAWISSGASIASITFGIGDRSVLYYDFLNFRVGQRFRERSRSNLVHLNPVDSPQDFSVTISDALDHTSPPILVSTFTSIPYTDEVGMFTKSIMHTVRIPLRAFTANGSPLDLQRVTQVKFTFDQNSTGELIFDDIEFLGLDVTEPD